MTLPAEAARAAANTIEARMTEVRKGNLGDGLRFWYDLKQEYEAFDTERKRVYEALEAMSRVTLPEMMAEQDTKSTTLELSGNMKVRFAISQRFSCSMPDKERGMEWLRENNLGDLIQPTVNAQTLSAAMRKRIEDDGMDPPEGLFNTSYMNFTSATKVK